MYFDFSILLYFLVFFVGLVGVIKIAYSESVRRKAIGIGQTNNDKEPVVFALLLFGMIIFIMGTRSFYGDTIGYAVNFDTDEVGSLGEVFDALRNDDGTTMFDVISAFIKIYISDKAQWFLFIIAAVTGILIAIPYRKYSDNIVLTVFLFIASGNAVWMANGIRQFLAVAITFFASVFLVKKKIIPFMLMVLIAYSIHSSALLMVPIYFIVTQKPWTNKSILMIITAVIVGAVLAPTMISENADTELLLGGVGIPRVAFMSLPVALIIWKKDEIKKKTNPMIDICINMALLTCGFFIIGMFTSGIYVGRIPIYFSLYNWILVPWVMKNCLTDREKPLFYYLTVIAFLFFYYVEVKDGLFESQMLGIYNTKVPEVEREKLDFF